MFRNSCQRGRLTIFFSCGSKPLNNWDIQVKDGYVTTFLDPEIKSMVLEIGGVNVSTTYITCPKGKTVLGISMPFLVMVVKNMKKYFTFEVTILDETGTRRRFRVANFQSTTQIMPLSTAMPIDLSDGWNQIQFNLYEFTRRAYNKQFVEVQKLKINANIRIRRIYFAEKLVPEDELPPEFRIFFPLQSKTTKGKDILKPTKSMQVLGSKSIPKISNEETKVIDNKLPEKLEETIVAQDVQEQPVVDSQPPGETKTETTNEDQPKEGSKLDVKEEMAVTDSIQERSQEKIQSSTRMKSTSETRISSSAVVSNHEVTDVPKEDIEKVVSVERIPSRHPSLAEPEEKPEN